jgi:hypothetical protein
MRFTVRIRFFAALEAARLCGPASTSELATPVHNSGCATISGAVAATMASRSNL